MKILIKPEFKYKDAGVTEIKGILSMANDGELSVNINAYFAEIFPGENRQITRLPRTNYYIVHTLLDETIEDIDEWYTGYLERAVDRGFDDMMKVEVEPYDSIEGRIDEAILFLNPVTIPIHDFFDFTTEEGRIDIMRYVDPYDHLDQIQIDHLFANKVNFTGLSFNNSILNNASFVGAFLPMGTFIKTKLNKAKLNGADLRYANLTSADLSEADLTGADLTGADLTDTDFQDAILTGAIFKQSTWSLAKNLLDNPTFTKPQPRQLVFKKAAEVQKASDEVKPGKNTCFSDSDQYDKNIKKYLAEDKDNFILYLNANNKKCESLEGLKSQHRLPNSEEYEGYYECNQSIIDTQNRLGFTRTFFSKEDYNTDVEYVKMGYNQHIVKPDWFYAGPVPEPRIFELVATGVEKRMISKRIALNPGANVVSDVHCDPRDTYEIYVLKPVIFKETARKKSTKQKIIKPRTVRKVLRRRTTGRVLTAADETHAGGGRKKKRTLKRRTLKKRTLKKRLKRN